MKLFLIIIFQIWAIIASAQVTNTRKWRPSERDSLDNALLLYEETNYKIALPILENIHKNHPKEEFIKYLYGICCLYRSDKYPECLTALTEVYANNKNIDKIEFDLARAYHYNYKFDEAIDFINKHLAYKRIRPDDKAKGELLKQYITNAKYYNAYPTAAKVTDLGNTINTPDDEFMPAISADEAVMVFNYTGIKSMGGKLNAYLQPDANGLYTSDIYLSQKQNGQFQSPQALDNINTTANETALSLSQDGQILFTYKDISDGHGDIYASYLVGDSYSKPSKLKGKVNTYTWDGNCSLSPDGKTLYFASERTGGYGGKDIYKAKLLADSVWGNITNLGDSINTPFDEDAPFIHADGVTLFYSSKCLKSSGGYDIFKSKLDLKDSIFKISKNVGFPINTPDDDIFFVLAANGANAYYSSGKAGGIGLKDIYKIETGFDKTESALVLVKGTISRGSESADAEIKVETVSPYKSVYKNFRSNKGKYLTSLPAGAEYKITFSKKGLPNQTQTISAISVSGYTEKIYPINFDQRVDTTKTIITPTLVVAEVTATVAAKAITPTVTAVKTNTVANVATKTIAATPTVAVVKTATVAAVTSKSIAITPSVAVTKTIAPVQTTSSVVVSTPTPAVKPAVMTMENFVPLTPAQEKIKLYTDKYPDISADSLDFRVQIAAFKFPKAYTFPHLKDCGPLENLLLLDGITRITVGGSFKTLRAAYQHNKKVVIAGQSDAFVTVIYKNRRILLEDLETMGIFKAK